MQEGSQDIPGVAASQKWGLGGGPVSLDLDAEQELWVGGRALRPPPQGSTSPEANHCRPQCPWGRWDEVVVEQRPGSLGVQQGLGSCSPLSLCPACVVWFKAQHNVGPNFLPSLRLSPSLQTIREPPGVSVPRAPSCRLTTKEPAGACDPGMPSHGTTWGWSRRQRAGTAQGLCCTGTRSLRPPTRHRRLQ